LIPEAGAKEMGMVMENNERKTGKQSPIIKKRFEEVSTPRPQPRGLERKKKRLSGEGRRK